ncbi:MAG: response regulator transcription factor [Oscillospiraceae bacterium]|nr:response regulator transcription factor [Oscillospiraceae bacterium]
MHKLLMVEDEERIREFVVPYLQKAGFEVDEAGDGITGLEMARSGRYSLILLDIMLPGMDGREVCAQLRKTSSVPVLMLTAKSEEADIVGGFESGADDYLTKPFSPRELTVRVKAIIARAYPEKKSAILEFGPLTLDTDSQQAALDAKPFALTPKEFDLLLLMARHPNKTFPREQLLSEVWGYEAVSDARTVDTHVKQIREKLGVYRGMLETVWGKGYKLNENNH